MPPLSIVSRNRVRLLRAIAWTVLLMPGIWVSAATAPGNVHLEPANTKAGYLARILINEVPFPGEYRWLSEEDTKAAMRSILFVLDARISHIPPGYKQEYIALVKTDDIIDVITASKTQRQCDGFYRDKNGDFKAVDRVHKRVDSLVRIASQGTPGKFARLLNYAQGLASAYMKGGIEESDLFTGVKAIGSTKVTGRAYSWMSDKSCYSPGGNLVKIPNEQNGSLGGNRFFTLKKL